MFRKKQTYRYKVCRIRRQTLFFVFTIILVISFGLQSKAHSVSELNTTNTPTAIFSASMDQEEPTEESEEEIEEESIEDEIEANEEADMDEETSDSVDEVGDTSDEELPFTLSLAADIFSQRMAKGTSISGGDPTFSPSVDLSHVSGFTAGFSMDHVLGSVIRFQTASVYLDYEYELSDNFGIGATYTHGFYSDLDSAIFAYAANQITIYSDFYWNGLLAGIDMDYYFGDNKLLYFSASVGYSFDISDDFRLSPSAGSSVSYNETVKGKSKSTKGKTKQELAFSNAYLGVSASYDLGRGFEAKASIRGIYSKEETSNKKTTQFSAMAGISYDLDF